jgi:L-fucose mutarotase
MLKTIPYSFTPDLLRLIMAMGHGEELLISDGNYPALTTGAPSIPRIYIPVPDIAQFLGELLRFFPLDETVDTPLLVMESARESGAYNRYVQTLTGQNIKAVIGTAERFAFYDRAATAAGIIITADTIKAGNILIKKGVVRDKS